MIVNYVSIISNAYSKQQCRAETPVSALHSIVGHADIDMTQHYLHVQDSIRQEAINKFSRAFPMEKTE